MKFQSFRGAVVIASVMVASVTASQAFAEIDVLSLKTVNNTSNNKTAQTTYTFTQSMILNSIGFVSKGEVLTTLSYTLDGTVVNLLESNLSAVDANGLQWYSLAGGGLSVNASSILMVTTKGALIPASRPRPAFYNTRYFEVVSTNSSSNVSYNGMVQTLGSTSSAIDTGVTNSNLRVSNPSSNVAPEPGSIALALTGGAALIGICIRRRRNAA
jgi:hypothetical protein